MMAWRSWRIGIRALAVLPGIVLAACNGSPTEVGDTSTGSSEGTQTADTSAGPSTLDSTATSSEPTTTSAGPTTADDSSTTAPVDTSGAPTTETTDGPTTTTNTTTDPSESESTETTRSPTTESSTTETPCVPDCAGLQCGPDPECNVECGPCDDDEACTDGTCAPLLQWEVIQARNRVPGQAIDGWAPDGIWVIGDADQGAMAWDGAGWGMLPEIPVPNHLGLVALAADAIWVWGHFNDAQLGFWDGASWETMEVPGVPWDLSADAPDDVWIAMMDRLEHYDGVAFETIDFPIPLSGEGVTSVWAASPTDVWAIAENAGDCRLWHYDGDQILPEAFFQPTGCPEDIAGTDGNDVWTFTDGFVQHFDGNTWTEIPAPISGIQTMSVRDGTVWFVRGGALSGMAFGDIDGFTTLSGVAGTMPGIGTYPHVLAWAQDDVWIVDYQADATPWHYTADGWRIVSGSAPYLDVDAGSRDFFAIWGATADDLWLGGEHLVHYDGLEFATVLLDVEVTDVFGLAADTIWAVGENRVYEYDGVAWTLEVLNPEWDVDSVWAAADDDVWAFGRDLTGFGSTALILHSDGGAWQRYVAYQPQGELGHAWGLDANNIWVGNSTMVTWNGVLWAPIAGFSGQSDGVALANGDKYTLTNNGGLWRYDANYDGEALGGINGARALLYLAPDDIWVLGPGVGHYDGNAFVTSPGEPVSPILRYEDEIVRDALAVDGELWAVGDRGLVLRYQ